MKVGEKLTNKFLTIKNVEQKNKDEKKNANKDLFFSDINI